MICKSRKAVKKRDPILILTRRMNTYDIPARKGGKFTV
jgi:hypothetical protein